MNKSQNRIKEFILKNDPGYYTEEFLEQLELHELEKIGEIINEIILWKKELKEKNEELKSKTIINNMVKDIEKSINK